MPCFSLTHRILFISSILLLIISIGTLGLTGHAKWLLVQYFPADAWYIWRGTDGTYDEQQTIQQWIAVDYNETYDRLAVARAVLGVVASVLSIWIMRAKPRAIMEEDTQVLFFLMAVSSSGLTTYPELTISLPRQYRVHHNCGTRSYIVRQHTCIRDMVLDPALPVIQALSDTDGVDKI